MKKKESYLDVANKLNILHLCDNPGYMLYKPNGALIYEKLRKYILKKHKKYGYQQVQSPSVVKSNLLEQSGHMQKYKENIYFLDEDNLCLKPMSCPNHIEIYSSENRNENHLPLNLFEFGQVFRKESSGSLQSLFRVRQFIQDDSHIFVDEKNLKNSIKKFILMSKEVYNELGFKEIKFYISLRPENRFGNDNLWDKSENILKQACIENNLEFELLPNSGAFYGPKIEIQVKDKLNRSWQLGVIQLDYVLPQRFDLKYKNKNLDDEQPIMLHHAVLGSLDRMIGILLESLGVHLPSFLHPYENVIIAVSEKQNDYAEKLFNYLFEKDNDIKIDLSDEKLGKKIAKYKSLGAINIIVVGEEEKNIYLQENKFIGSINNKKIYF